MRVLPWAADGLLAVLEEATVSKAMKTRAAAPSTPSTSEAPPVADHQAGIGNQETQARLAGTDHRVGDWWTDLLGWFGMDEEVVHDAEVISDSPASDQDVLEEIEGPELEVEEAEEVVHEHAEAVEAAEEEAPKDVAQRPKTVRPGQYGALILAGGGTVEVRGAAGAEASVVDQIPDGTPCRVVSVDGAFLEVAFRKGDEEEKGWVSAAAFSSQPRLYKDEKNANLQQDLTWTLAGGDQTTDDLAGSDVQQGGLADCYFIAAMNAVGNASPDFLEESITYDASTGIYRVRFFEESGWDRATGQPKYEQVFIEVDGYLPTKGASTAGAYASAGDDKTQWGAIMEKAYAVWKGGYDAIGDGGYGTEAMEALAGARSTSADTSSMDEDAIVQYFRDAQAKGLAVYCGSNASMELTAQACLTGSGSGPYTGALKQDHDWNHVWPGTLTVEDQSGEVGQAWESGRQGDKEGALKGADVEEGKVLYDANTITVTYTDGKAPESAGDLLVKSEFTGMLNPAKQIIGWHGYAFDEVTEDGLIQLYNPWGSWQPKPITAAEFKEFYGDISTVQVPQAKAES